MNLERPELRLVREKLESVLSPGLVQSALFEALAEVGGRPPTSQAAIVALVDGPLRRALKRRLDDDDLGSLIEEILAAIQLAFASSPPPNKGRPRDMEVTLEITRGKGAVGVLVISGTDDLAARLQVALGPSRVAARTCTTREEIETLLHGIAPAIILVDAVEFPPVEPVELAELMAAASRSTVRAIWGADLGYGSVVLGELVERHAPVTPLDRREGIEPLLDLVRSRAG
jgi:hypothetical protein